VAALPHILAWALATVLAVACVGKLADLPGHGSLNLPILVVAGAEGVLAALLALSLWTTVISVLVMLLAAAYAAVAIRSRKGRDCHCFGERLPSTNIRGQRGRNIVLFVAAALYVLVSPANVAISPTITPLAITVGLVTGLAIVIGPWLQSWLLE
jgi:hypothetical protein